MGTNGAKEAIYHFIGGHKKDFYTSGATAMFVRLRSLPVPHVATCKGDQCEFLYAKHYYQYDGRIGHKAFEDTGPECTYSGLTSPNGAPPTA